MQFHWACFWVDQNIILLNEMQTKYGSIHGFQKMKFSVKVSLAMENLSLKLSKGW